MKKLNHCTIACFLLSVKFRFKQHLFKLLENLVFSLTKALKNLQLASILVK